MRDDEAAGEVDADDALELGDGDFERGHLADDAGGIDDGIDAAELFGGGAHGGGNAGFVDHVGADGHVTIAELLGNGIDLGLAGRGGHDFCAGGGKAQGDGAADACGAAGDEADFVADVETFVWHGRLQIGLGPPPLPSPGVPGEGERESTR